MSSPQQSGANEAPAASGSSFYAAMRILPPRQREAMYAVYAFCRAVDDIADEGGPQAEQLAAIDAWKRDIDRLYTGRGETKLTEGLLSPIETFGLRQDDFLAVINGIEMDVRRDIKAPDWEELDLYCDRVASAVGRLSVRIFGLDETNGLALSHHLGRALQMTNILRDIDEDAAIGRLYLPREALSEAGIADADIADVLASPALDSACRIVAARARAHFEEAENIMARCQRNSVRSPRLMAAVYRPMLDRLVLRGWQPPRKKLHHSRPQVLWAILRHGLL
jgi:presqualene diphosphate synthase